MKDLFGICASTSIGDVEFSGAAALINEAIVEAAFEAAANSTPAIDNAQKMLGYVTTARAAFRQSKSSAAEAAVLCYLVYRGTRSTEGAQWLTAQIDAANAAIKIHNAAEKTLQEEVVKFKAAVAAAPANAATMDNAAMLAELAALKEADWDRRVKVQIGARNGAAEWTSAVKLALELNSAFNASVVSRYCTVVGWLARHFPTATDSQYAPMVAAILAAGGFDYVYAEEVAFQRSGGADDDANDGSDNSAIPLTDSEIIAKHKAAQIDAGMKSLPSIGAITLPVKHDANGFTVLLGRVNNGTVEIVGEAEMSEKRLADIVTKHGAVVSNAAQPSAKFLWNVMSLGDLVASGQTTKLMRHGLNGGEALKVERRLVVRNTDLNGGYQVMVSARNTEASIIIKAKPNAAVVKLGPPTGLLGLSAKSYSALYDLLSEPINRSLWAVSADHSPVCANGELAKNIPAWAVHCDVLEAAGSKTHTKTLYLNDITRAHHLPLDVDGFRSAFLQDLKKSDLVDLYREKNVGWDKVKKADKTGQTMMLDFANQHMTLKSVGQEDYTIPAFGELHPQVALTFRAQQLMAVLGKLCEVDAETFTVSGDKGGLLIISWKDAVGSYELCLPTCAADGSLQSRRLAEMSVEDFLFVPQIQPTA